MTVRKFGEIIMFNHYDTNEKNICLHDCTAKKVKIKNDNLIFYFNDGFWICTQHENNKLNETVRTDKSKVKYHLTDINDITVYVFYRKRNKAIRKEWSVDKLLKRINSGKYSLEFLYQYRDFNSRILKCMLVKGKKRYFRECEIIIATDKVTYCWNKLCEDRKW